MFLSKNTTKILLFIPFLIFLNSCGIYKPTDAKEFPPEPEKRVAKNIEEGRGFRLFNDENKGGNGTFDFATSNELWRASLDTLDFMPLISADYGGGILITDWFNENNNYRDYIKISIRFLTNEIRSDALDIKIFLKQCDANNKCIINKNDGKLVAELTKNILSKAARLQKAKIDKNKKENPYVMGTPGS